MPSNDEIAAAIVRRLRETEFENTVQAYLWLTIEIRAALNAKDQNITLAEHNAKIQR